MSNFKILVASGYCGIDDKGINGIYLVRSNACYNPKITNDYYIVEIYQIDIKK